MKNKKVTIDLRTAGHFGVSCKSFEILEFFRLSGFKVDLIMNNWEYMAAASGLTFNSNTKLYSKGASVFLWDPKLHPIDVYENLIVSSFDNINFIYKKKFSLLQKIRIFIITILSTVFIFFVSELSFD